MLSNPVYISLLFYVLNLLNTLKSLQQWLVGCDQFYFTQMWCLCKQFEFQNLLIAFIRDYRFPIFDHFPLRLCWKITRKPVLFDICLTMNSWNRMTTNNNWKSLLILFIEVICLSLIIKENTHKKTFHLFRVDISSQLKYIHICMLFILVRKFLS